MEVFNKNILKNVILDYKSEVNNFDIIDRNFSFEKNANYVFVGARRSGKSFLLFQRMKQLRNEGISEEELLYLNFEDERLIGLKSTDLNSILEIHWELYQTQPILFLDEIQNIEGWEKFARRLADSKYRVYITGSNAKMLSKDIQTTLGGRFLSKEVFPFNFQEYLSAINFQISDIDFNSTKGKAELKHNFNNYFYFGGFPECIPLEMKRDYLTSLYQKIYLGDIALRHTVENTFALKILFKKIAESVKQPISYNRISNIISSTGTKVGTNTIINYIEYAKDAWLIHTIRNIADKLVVTETKPKYYFVDNGLLNLFLIDENTSLLENLVAITLLRKHSTQDSVYFYHKNIEVDFYIPEIQTAIQVCYNLDSSIDTFERETRALIKLTKALPCNQLLIITKDEEKTLNISGEVIQVIPIWKWILQSNK